MSAYRKGRRLEYDAMYFMKYTYNCVCMRSAGSHGTADLICGNGTTVFVIQVKSWGERNEVNWADLKAYADKFKALPIVLTKKPKRGWIILHTHGGIP